MAEVPIGEQILTRQVPGWNTFERNFQKAAELPPSAKLTFVTHDLRNATGPFLSAFKWYYQRKSPESLKADAAKPKQAESASELLATIEKALGLTYDSSLTSKDPEMGAYYQTYFDTKLPHLRKAFPILKASTLFLENPTREKAEELLKMRIDMKTIVNLAVNEASCSTDAKLNGPEAIIAFNLLNNAQRYGSKDSVYAGIDDKTNSVAEIRNHAAHALPPHPFVLGEKGTNSVGFGAGLYIAKHLYAPLAQAQVRAFDNGVDVETISQSVPPASVEPPHKIQFFMTRNQENPLRIK